MPTRPVRLALPLLLAAWGVAFLAGCIPIPVFRRTGGLPRPETRFGPAGSDKPLEVRRATREDVRRILGMPATMQGEGAVVYRYMINSIFWFPCYQQTATRYLRVEFDEEGRVSGYRVLPSQAEAQRPLKLH